MTTALPEIKVGSKWRSSDRRDWWAKIRQEMIVVWVKDDEVLFDDSNRLHRRTTDGGIEGVEPL